MTRYFPSKRKCFVSGNFTPARSERQSLVPENVFWRQRISSARTFAIVFPSAESL